MFSPCSSGSLRWNCVYLSSCSAIQAYYLAACVTTVHTRCLFPAQTELAASVSFALSPALLSGRRLQHRRKHRPDGRCSHHRNQVFSSSLSAKPESNFSSQRDCFHQPMSIIKKPAMKIAVRTADVGETTHDTTNPVPALVRK